MAFLKGILRCGDSVGNLVFNMTTYINRMIFLLEILKENFDKTFLKQFLMHKNNSSDNFLVRDFKGRYSDPSNFDDLIKLLTLIFTIFNKDLELFEDLFKSKNKTGNCFFKKLQENYKNENEKLSKIMNWVKENLGDDFLKKLESN